MPFKMIPTSLEYNEIKAGAGGRLLEWSGLGWSWEEC